MIGVPQENPLVPTHGRYPSAHAKEAPVDADGELRVPVHDAELHAGLYGRGGVLRPRHGRSVRPQPDRHVVTRTDQDIARVRAPRQPSDRVVVPHHDRRRAGRRASDVKRPYRPVHAAGRDHRVVVLVPVVCEDLGRHRWWCQPGRQRHRGRGMHGDLIHEVVLRIYRCAQVEDAQVRVGRHGGYYVGIRGAV